MLQWAYRSAGGYEQMSDVPLVLRAGLSETLPLWTVTPVERETSPDRRTEKVVFRLPDDALIETVYMKRPSKDLRTSGSRTTICVSSQAGCAYGCTFCATGQQGYGRNLSSGEIVQQAAWGFSQGPITNVVFMGMGEPFANYDATMGAVRALNAPWGLGLGARHITVSTVGLAPEIRRFALEPMQAGLAVSLHAANDELRSKLMPVNRKYPLRVLMPACREYVARTNRRITFEYVLLGGVNDSTGDAQELAGLLRGLLAHVNVIPVNPTDGSFARPRPSRIRGFVEEVRNLGVPITLRDTQGVEIQAGCGQLRAPTLARA